MSLRPGEATVQAGCFARRRPPPPAAASPAHPTPPPALLSTLPISRAAATAAASAELVAASAFSAQGFPGTTLDPVCPTCVTRDSRKDARVRVCACVCVCVRVCVAPSCSTSPRCSTARALHCRAAPPRVAPQRVCVCVCVCVCVLALDIAFARCMPVCEVQDQLTAAPSTLPLESVCEAGGGTATCASWRPRLQPPTLALLNHPPPACCMCGAGGWKEPRGGAGAGTCASWLPRPPRSPVHIRPCVIMGGAGEAEAL
jgi:hypothetical protein